MKWISVKDELPTEEYKCYIVYMKEIGVLVVKWYGTVNEDRPWEYTGWKLPYPFTHWMRLPPDPEEL